MALARSIILVVLSLPLWSQGGLAPVRPDAFSGVDTGAANAYVVTTLPRYGLLTRGTYRFSAAHSNTGASTLNVNGTGAHTVVKLAGSITTALIANDIRVGQMVAVTWDGTNFQMVSPVGTAPVASVALAGTDSNSQVVAASSHGIASTLACVAASASGTAYTCSTSPTFTPAANDCVLFVADVANTGDATLSVNSATALHFSKQQSGAVLAANDLLAGARVIACMDAASHWQIVGQTGNTSGSLVLLESHTASSSATLDFTSISSTYENYLFVISRILPATNATNLLVRLSTNGGSTYDSGSNYSYVNRYNGIGGDTGILGNAAASAIQITTTLSNSSNYGASGNFQIYALGSGVYKMSTAQFGLLADNSTFYEFSDSGVYLSTTAVNAVRFLFSSGNIASGTIRMYGVAQ